MGAGQSSTRDEAPQQHDRKEPPPHYSEIANEITPFTQQGDTESNTLRSNPFSSDVRDATSPSSRYRSAEPLNRTLFQIELQYEKELLELREKQAAVLKRLTRSPNRRSDKGEAVQSLEATLRDVRAWLVTTEAHWQVAELLRERKEAAKVRVSLKKSLNIYKDRLVTAEARAVSAEDRATAAEEQLERAEAMIAYVKRDLERGPPYESRHFLE